MLESSVQEFAKKVLKPRLEENDRFPWSEFFTDAVEKAVELEYFHVSLPEELNGWGGKLSPLNLILKSISEVDASLAAILLTNAVSQELLLSAGEAEFLRELFGRHKPSRDLLTAYPLLMNPEENEIELSAEKTTSGYTLSGRAEYVVMAPFSRWALMPAQVEKCQRYSFFLMDLDQKGVKSEGPVFSMGLHACPAADLILANAEARLIGKEDEGPELFERMVTRMLPAAASVACGLMRGSLREAIQYARKRKQGGRNIFDWSELRLILSDMMEKANVSQILLDHAFRAADGRESKWAEDACTAAIYILDAASDLTSNGIQALGGYGYTKHSFQERRFRDAQHLRSVFGTMNPRRLDYVERNFNR
ncbi:MAG: acyl-CoA dehydrogenase family protein [Thermodesulfobacteriota bacterium]